MSQISDRGGGQAYLGHCPKFYRFLIMTPPLRVMLEILEISEQYLNILKNTTTKVATLAILSNTGKYLTIMNNIWHYWQIYDSTHNSTLFNVTSHMTIMERF